jgi:hypothetical protein
MLFGCIGTTWKLVDSEDLSACLCTLGHYTDQPRRCSSREYMLSMPKPLPPDTDHAHLFINLRHADPMIVLYFSPNTACHENSAGAYDLKRSDAAP